MPTTRVAYPRAAAFYDTEGKLLARAISLWVLMDMDRRTMVLPGKSGVTVAGIERGIEPAAPKSLMIRPQSQSRTNTVTYSLLDINGHMNNTRYLDWVCDLLPAAFHGSHTLKEFTLCYHSEALENQQVQLQFGMEEAGVFQVDAHRERTDVLEQTERVFHAQLVFTT
jgi:acyl-ACP thioesterase